MTKADGGYLISQVTSRNFSQPLTGKDGTRVKISGGVGFVVVSSIVPGTYQDFRALTENKDYWVGRCYQLRSWY